MKDDVHLDPRAVDAFVGELGPPRVDAVARWQPEACPGGLPECRAFTDVEVAARDAMTAQLANLAQVFEQFKQVANACRADYANTDVSRAEQIARARDHISGKG